ncbi:uncharacterized protein [Rutidosis leptorrhynchoides]|uniref:uncharacterized protein n=1 Tax=Rutidosis leptorrhynchoides TaxID=125765 RepID=UPI003A9A43EC
MRNNKNTIQGLLIDGIWNDTPEVIKDEAASHFASRFKENDHERPSLDGLEYPLLAASEANCLEERFEGKEICDAIFECDGNKALGPEGFKLRFFKQYWDTIKSPTKEFSLERGVRQGDPPSLFLFILAAEELNILVKSALDKGLFKGIEVRDDKIHVSHLQYADDTIFMAEYSRSNARSLQNLLKCFELASGLKGGSDSGSKISWVKWDTILNSYGMGGLNIGLPPPFIAGNNLEEIGIEFKNSFTKSIGNGADTAFWNEVWVGNNKLRDLYPRLYRLETEKNAIMLAEVRLGDEKYKWIWALDGEKEFTVKKLSGLCDDLILASGIAWMATRTSCEGSHPGSNLGEAISFKKGAHLRMFHLGSGFLKLKIELIVAYRDLYIVI